MKRSGLVPRTRMQKNHGIVSSLRLAHLCLLLMVYLVYVPAVIAQDSSLSEISLVGGYEAAVVAEGLEAFDLAFGYEGDLFVAGGDSLYRIEPDFSVRVFCQDSVLFESEFPALSFDTEGVADGGLFRLDPGGQGGLDRLTRVYEDGTVERIIDGAPLGIAMFGLAIAPNRPPWDGDFFLPAIGLEPSQDHVFRLDPNQDPQRFEHFVTGLDFGTGPAGCTFAGGAFGDKLYVCGSSNMMVYSVDWNGDPTKFSGFIRDIDPNILGLSDLIYTWGEPFGEYLFATTWTEPEAPSGNRLYRIHPGGVVDQLAKFRSIPCRGLAFTQGGSFPSGLYVAAGNRVIRIKPIDTPTPAPPRFRDLPDLRLLVGTPYPEALDLREYVTDTDTPVEDLRWFVYSNPWPPWFRGSSSALVKFDAPLESGHEIELDVRVSDGVTRTTDMAVVKTSTFFIHPYQLPPIILHGITPYRSPYRLRDFVFPEELDSEYVNSLEWSVSDIPASSTGVRSIRILDDTAFEVIPDGTPLPEPLRISFYAEAGPLPISTPTRTHTPTPTNTRMPLPTPRPPNTPTATFTPTTTMTFTSVPTPTKTPTPTATNTPMPTATFTPTTTMTFTSVPTPTKTHTPTATNTPTPSPTPSPSVTPTPEPFSLQPRRTPPPLPERREGLTPRPPRIPKTPTPTRTLSPTQTSTPTPRPSTPTVTPTATPTATPIQVVTCDQEFNLVFLGPFPTGETPYDLAVGDFNEDGVTDLITANLLADSLSLFLGRGDGTFSPTASIQTAEGPTSIAVAHMNEDGHDDLVIVHSYAQSLWTLLGDGRGGFLPGATVPIPLTREPDVSTGAVRLRLLSVGDVTGDGHLDAVVPAVELDADKLIFYQGDGRGGLELASSLTLPGIFINLVTADFNGNGLSDVAVATRQPYLLGVYLNRGDRFERSASFATDDEVAGSDLESLSALDADQDGRTDLAASLFDGTRRFYFGRGDGTFDRMVLRGLVKNALTDSIAAADLDMNGIPELILLNREIGGQGKQSISIVCGGAPRFYEAAATFRTGRPASPFSRLPMVINDLNGDGRPDIAACDTASDDVFVFVNRSGDE